MKLVANHISLALSLSTFTVLISACASHQNRNVAAEANNNLVVIPAGWLSAEGYSWRSTYVIDKATKDCFTQLNMYSSVKIDCAKLKAVPEAAKVLKEIGI